jgi:hypothetical protein
MSSMAPKIKALFLALIMILSVGIAIYASLFFQSRRFTILDHTFRPDPVRIVFIAVPVFMILVAVWVAVARQESRRAGLEAETVLKRGLSACLPLLLFFLSPALISNYLTREDFQARLAGLGVLAIAGVLVLSVARRRSEFGGRPGPATRILARFEAWPRKKKIAALFLAAFAVYNLAVLALVGQGIEFSGDEPNYLITADSLLYDQDINLANNYAHEDWFHFYSRETHPRLKLGIYGRYGKEGKDHIYPINLPGISFLMLPFYGVGRLLGGKALIFLLKGSLSVWAALLGVQIYLFAAERWKKERISLTLWGLYAFTAPVFFFAVHLYPEVPIAFMSLLIYRKVTSSAPLRPFHYPALGFLLATFFWFGVKYNIIFWPLLAVSVFHLWKTHGARTKLVGFLAFPVASAALFMLYIHSLYGSFSPFSIYEGVMTADQFREWKRMVFSIPLGRRIDAFLDYFLDQRDGLLLYSPLYVFAFPGFIEMFRKAKREFFFLLLIALPFVLNYGFFTHRQGYSPQGRVLASVSWVAVVAIGYFLAANVRPVFSGMFRFFAAASVAAAALLLFHPRFLYQPTTHQFTERAGDLFVFLGNLHVFLPAYLPSFIKIDNSRYAPNYVWVGILLAFLLLYLFWKRKTETGTFIRTVVTFVLLGAAAFLWVLFPRDSLYPVETIPISEARTMGIHTFSVGRDVVIKPNGDLYLHSARTYRVLFSSRREFEGIKVAYGSEKGRYRIRARFFDLPLFEDRTDLQKKEYIFVPRAEYKVKGLTLYEIDFDIRQDSSENMRIDPYFLSITPIR